MKQLSLLLFLCISFFINLPQSIGQHANFGCGDEIYRTKQLELAPEKQIFLDQEEDRLRRKIQKLRSNPNQRFSASGTGEYVIPIVVHIMAPSANDPVNISYAQINSQIDALNDNFAGNPSINIPDTGIRFCLARTSLPDAQGNTTPWNDLNEPGVMRYFGTGLSNNDMTAATNQAMLDITHPVDNYIFPFENYLNIWLVNEIAGSANGTILGYAPNPIGPEMGNTSAGIIDGVINRSDAFGSNLGGGNFNLFSAEFDQGKTMVHEIGHYLRLYHTFHMTACNNTPTSPCSTTGDFVCDTDPVQQPVTTVYSCNSYENCNASTTDVTNNHMFYSADICKFKFTDGQIDRMHAYIEDARSNLVCLNNLQSAGLYESGGCLGTDLSAQFGIPSPICVDESISFAPFVLAPNNEAVSWLWSFDDGSSATTETTNKTFTSIGSQSVTLTVTDAQGIQENFTLNFEVSSCELELPGQANWYFGNRAAIDFSSGVPVPINNSQMNALEGCYTQSDQNGNLLFYGNIRNLYDQNHNSYNLYDAIYNLTIPNSGTTNSVAQMICIPDPADATGNVFLVFIVPTASPSTNSNFNYIESFRITVASNGSLTISDAQILDIGINVNDTSSFPSEKITAIPHCNQTDYWIVGQTHNLQQGNRFYTFRVSATGISNADFSSSTADVYPPDLNGNAQFFDTNLKLAGHMKSNISGDRIAVSGGFGSSQGGIVLFDFDRATGEVDNEELLTTDNTYDLSFSPNGDYVYATIGQNTTSIPNDILQFDLINNQSYVLASSVDTDFMSMQLGPDGHLYFARSNSTFVGRILNPNNLFPTVELEAIDFFPINPDIIVLAGLPDMVDAQPGTPEDPSFDFEYQGCTEVVFEIEGCWAGNQVQWNFGDGTIIGPGNLNDTAPEGGTFANPVHNYVAGNYNAIMTIFAGSSPAFPPVSQSVEILDNTPPTIFGLTDLCQNTTTDYFVIPSAGFTYDWMITGGTFANGSTQISGTNIQVIWDSPGTGQLSVTAIHPGENCPPQTSIISVNVDAAPCDPSSCNFTLEQQCLPNGLVQITVLDEQGDQLVLGPNDNLAWTTVNAPNQTQITMQPNVPGFMIYFSPFCSNTISFTSDDCCNIQNIGPLTTNQTWNTVDWVIDETVVVPNGITLSIAGSTLRFTPNGRIVVEDGGRLYIKTSTLTNSLGSNCPNTSDMWPGILSYETAYVEAINSTIEWADIGIQVLKGRNEILNIQGTNFNSNEQGIAIGKTSDQVEFTIEKNRFYGTQNNTYGIFMEDVIISDAGEELLSNVFLNSDYGIRGRNLYNSELRMVDNTFGSTTIWGIHLNNTTGNTASLTNHSRISIDNNYFRSVERGIYCSKTNSTRITNNTLDAIRRMGIRIHRVVYYYLGANTVNGDLSSSLWRAGIYITESDEINYFGNNFSSLKIENNYLKDFNVGLAFRDYQTSNHKVQISCNRFHTCKSGIVLTNLNWSSTYLNEQGSLNSPFFNRFQNNTFDIRINQPTGTITTFNNYYYPDCQNITCGEYQPNISGAGNYNNPIAAPSFVTSIPCQSQISAPRLISQASHLKLYPNPSTGMVNLSMHFPEVNNELLAISIFAPDGKKLKQLTWNYTGTETIPLQLDQLPSGMYFVEVQSTDFSFREKLVLIR